VRQISSIKDDQSREAILELQLAIRKIQAKLETLNNSVITNNIFEGTAFIRRGLLAERGVASEHKDELFLETRTPSTKGDVLWASVLNTSATSYGWVSLFKWGGV
jgi:hypothetical protein